MLTLVENLIIRQSHSVKFLKQVNWKFVEVALSFETESLLKVSLKFGLTLFKAWYWFDLLRGQWRQNHI